MPYESTRPIAASAEQPVGDCGALDLKVVRHFGENGRERPDSEARVDGNGEVVFALQLGGEAQMAPCLPRDRVPIHGESPGKILTGQIARQLHAAITSSRTRWRRNTVGIAGGSK